jgi:hypothetical protein
MVIFKAISLLEGHKINMNMMSRIVWKDNALSKYMLAIAIISI